MSRKLFHENRETRSTRSLGESPEEQLELLTVAIDASNNCVAIADARLDDTPLIYVNRGFERLTGYDRDECLGHNCRFLQRDDRDQPAVAELRRAVARGEDCRVTLRNYRKDGSMFWNELYLSAIYDQNGKLAYFMGVQNDVSDRVRYETQLREAIEETLRDASWFTRSILDKLAQLRGGAIDRADEIDLTPRERETLALMARGHKNREIAEALELAPNTVRNYIARIYQKLGVHSRADAVIWARERGLNRG